jgi:hypothetical protein
VARVGQAGDLRPWEMLEVVEASVPQDGVFLPIQNKRWKLEAKKKKKKKQKF